MLLQLHDTNRQFVNVVCATCTHHTPYNLQICFAWERNKDTAYQYARESLVLRVHNGNGTTAVDGKATMTLLTSRRSCRRCGAASCCDARLDDQVVEDTVESTEVIDTEDGLVVRRGRDQLQLVHIDVIADADGHHLDS